DDRSVPACVPRTRSEGPVSARSCKFDASQIRRIPNSTHHSNLRAKSPGGSEESPLPGSPDWGSERLQVDRGGLALLTALNIEADLLALIEAHQPRPLERRDVDEYILGPVSGLDEAVALLSVEPFDCAFRHRAFLHAIRSSTPRGKNAFQIGA